MPDSDLVSRHKAEIALAHEVIISSTNSPLQQAHGHIIIGHRAIFNFSELDRGTIWTYPVIHIKTFF